MELTYMLRMDGCDARCSLEGGKVEAEVDTRSIEVEGSVTGNVTASDKYELKKGGVVEGDVRAPRVLVADGARFKRNIDMAEGGPRSEAPKAPPKKR